MTYPPSGRPTFSSFEPAIAISFQPATMSTPLAPPLDINSLPGSRQVAVPPADAPEREILHAAADAPSHQTTTAKDASSDPEVNAKGDLDLPAPAGPEPPATLKQMSAPAEDNSELVDDKQDLPSPAGPPAPSPRPATTTTAEQDDPEITPAGTLDLPEPAGPDAPQSAAEKIPFKAEGETNATQVNELGQATKKHAPQDKIASLPSAAEIPTHPAGGKVVPRSLETLDHLAHDHHPPSFIQRAEGAIISILPVDLPSDLNLEAAPPPAYAVQDGKKDPAINTAHQDVPGKTHEQVDPVGGDEVDAEVEKRKALRRDVLGHEAGGTVVLGIEDDHLWSMLRRFDKVG